MIVRRSRSGRRLMSPSRSTSTGLLLFLTGSRYWPEPSWPEGILFSGGGSGVPGHARLRRQAVDVLLADQRLRADFAARVFAEVLEAVVVDVQHDGGLRLRGRRDRGDLADLDAGDLHLLAGDDVAGVVEDRPDFVAAVVAAGGESRARPPRAGGMPRPSPRPLSCAPRLLSLTPILPLLSRQSGRPHLLRRGRPPHCFGAYALRGFSSPVAPTSCAGRARGIRP